MNQSKVQGPKSKVEPLHRTSRAMLAAYRKGRAAKPGDPCPYFDHRGGRHGQVTTWSRAFQGYWYEGLKHAAENLPEQYTA